MANLGRKYTCYSCHTKFYDLGKPVPTCPKCGADQREAEQAPAVPVGRGRRAVIEPVEDEIPEVEGEETAETEDEEFPEPEVEEEDDDDEEEDY